MRGGPFGSFSWWLVVVGLYVVLRLIKMVGGVQKGDGLFKRPSGCLLDYIRAYFFLFRFGLRKPE